MCLGRHFVRALGLRTMRRQFVSDLRVCSASANLRCRLSCTVASSPERYSVDSGVRASHCTLALVSS